jgi:hypothetical protein
MGWMAPLRHQCAKPVLSENHQEREPSISEITTIGLDLAKHVFQVHGVAKCVGLSNVRPYALPRGASRRALARDGGCNV